MAFPPNFKTSNAAPKIPNFGKHPNPGPAPRLVGTSRPVMPKPGANQPR